MKYFIKYMVSTRCKMVVKAALDNLGISYETIDLGIIEITENISVWQRDSLKQTLRQSGLELMDDKKAIITEKIKSVVIDMLDYSAELPKIKNSDYISEKLDDDYTDLANIFSEVTGMTLEHYIIIHKIERVKELILNDSLSLTDISFQLNYSSVAHLSNQFKKVTGLTPSDFKKFHHSRQMCE